MLAALVTSLFPLEASFLRGSRGHRPCLEWRRGGQATEGKLGPARAGSRGKGAHGVAGHAEDEEGDCGILLWGRRGGESPPFSTSAAQTGLVLRRGRTRTHSYICISRILRSRERERRELETQVGEEDISHPIPSIHPSRPPQLREASHPRISSSPLPAPPEAARVRPRRSSSATDVATEHEKPTPKKKHPFNPISRRAPSVDRQAAAAAALPLLLPPPPFSYPLSVYYPASA